MLPNAVRSLTRAPHPVIASAVVVLALAGCGATAPLASPTRTVAPSSTPAGPTDFAAWTARQGFGGSSGLNEVHKDVAWLGDHPSEVTVGLVDVEAIPVVADLATWLDEHPPTTCWAAYHDAARTDLATIQAGYVAVRAAVASGKAMPTDVQARMEAAGQQALDRHAPAGCP